MSKQMEDDNGNMVTVFTAEEVKANEEKLKAEYEAKLADKDKHLGDKTDEFVKAKALQDAKDAERDQKIAEANKKAEEADKKATEAEMRRQNTIKDSAKKNLIGSNAELGTKFDESWGLINLEIKEDADILRKADMVANMMGLNSQNIDAAGLPMGGQAPRLSEAEKQKKESDHSTFLQATGLEDFIPKPEENK